MKKIWEAWKKFAKVIGDFQFKILFSALYLLVVTPMSLLASSFIDPLSNKTFPKWRKIKDDVSTLERIRKQ